MKTVAGQRAAIGGIAVALALLALPAAQAEDNPTIIWNQPSAAGTQAPAPAAPTAPPSNAPIRENLAPPPGQSTADNSIIWDSPRSPGSPAPAPAPVKDCREYQRQIQIDGKMQMAHGTACRQPDGSWRIVD
jgi:hypothetical protein